MNCKLLNAPLLVMLACLGASAATYHTGYEDASKTAYAPANVTLSGLVWRMDNALIGTTVGSDRFIDLKSARCRALFTNAMVDAKANGIGVATFKYAKYGADLDVTAIMEWSTNGGAMWYQSGPTFTSTTATLTDFSTTVNQNGDVMIRFRSISYGATARMNIDNITLYDYSGGGGSAAATNVVAMIRPTTPPVVTAAVNQAVAFATWSWSNGTATVGYGTTADGSGWTWVDAGLSNAASPYVATNAFAFASPATYYYGARWIAGGTTYNGWNANGQTNASAMSAQYTVVVTGAAPPTTVISNITVLSANLTSGNSTEYLGPGQRLLKGLQADIVAIQEWDITNASYRQFVDVVLGTNYQYHCGSGGKPSGVISRYPILSSGEWDQPAITDREFDWALIDIPGPTNLFIVSVHLKAGSTTADQQRRTNEVTWLTNYIHSTAAATSGYLIIAGDFNLTSDTERPMQILTSVLTTDAHKPVDQFGDKDTNAGRVERYDYVMPNPLLNGRHATTVVSVNSFPEGMVFDSRVWSPTNTLPPPILSDDTNNDGISGSEHYQFTHMPVMKTFAVNAPADVVNTTNVVTLVSPVAPPVVTAAQNQAVAFMTRSWSNGTAAVGYGTSADGTGWKWTDAVVTNGASPYVAVTNFGIPYPGVFYYGVRWVSDGRTFYGWNAGGQTNAFSMSAQYQVVVTGSVPLTLVQAEGMGLGGAVLVGPVAVSTTNDFSLSRYNWFVQDDTRGVLLTDPSSNRMVTVMAAANVKPNDRLILSGTNEVYNGLYELTTITIVTNYGPGASLSNAVITIEDLQNGAPAAEVYESMLVVISNVMFTNVTTFAGVKNYGITNGTLGAVVRINENNDPLVGQAAPTGLCSIVGIISQYDATDPRDGGYQLFPLEISGITEPPSNVVRMIQSPVLTAAPNTLVSLRTTSLSNGTVQIGYGTTADGSGWTWTNAIITNASSPYVAVTNVSFPVYGKYYYAARWTLGTYTYHGVDDNGQTNAFSMPTARYSIVVTNPNPSHSVITNVWINEANYDDTSGDNEEFIELCGKAGTTVTGWRLLWFNGLNGSVYMTNTVGTFTFANETNGYGFYVICWTNSNGVNPAQAAADQVLDGSVSGEIQNGSPDAVWLETATGTRVHFIEYEGMRAGGYGGISPDEMELPEDPTTDTESLSKINGPGSNFNNFAWAITNHTPGLLNVGQVLTVVTVPPTNVVRMVQSTVVTTAPNVAVSLRTTSTSNGTVQIGFGTTTDGTGWTWTNASVTNAASPYVAVTNIHLPYYGAFYYAARWTVNALTNYGVDENGQTNAYTMPAAVYRIVATNPSPSRSVVTNIWINEADYDDTSGDNEEFVELCGKAGMDITGWRLLWFNGANGLVYMTNTVGTFAFANETNGYGFYVICWTNSNGANPAQAAADQVLPSTTAGALQNGSPDAVWLETASGTRVHFIEYEGMRAGGYGGISPDEMELPEDSGLTNLMSLSKVNGPGSNFNNFAWAVTNHTPGLLNVGQTVVVPPDPSDVSLLAASRVAYGEMVLSWSNGPVTVLACTNRTYTTNGACWFVLAGNVSSPWTHTDASNYPSVYYRIVGGTYTSVYDVGKFDVTIAAGSIAWLSFPFGVQAGCDALGEWFGQQLEARPYTDYNFVSLQRQTTPGGTIEYADYYFDNFDSGTTNWFGPSNVVANAGYVLFLPANHGAVKITGIGMVQTNNVTMQIPYNSMPWLGLAYPVALDMRDSSVADLFIPAKLYSTFNYDFVGSQQTPGGAVQSAEYYIDDWGAGATNFFPSVPGADILEAGKGYLLFFSTMRGTGTGTWSCVRPY